MLTATAVARILGSTTFTIIELMGLVEANRQSSAATIALQYTAGVGAVRATSVRGAAASVTGPARANTSAARGTHQQNEDGREHQPRDARHEEAAAPAQIAIGQTTHDVSQRAAHGEGGEEHGEHPSPPLAREVVGEQSG